MKAKTLARLRDSASVFLLVALAIGPMFIWRSPPTSKCFLLWRECFDIQEIVKMWAWSRPMRNACVSEAEKIVGDKLTWPPVRFRYYYLADTQFKSGTLVLVEHDVKRNGVLSMSLECRIDLRERKVTSVRRLEQQPIIR